MALLAIETSGIAELQARLNALGTDAPTAVIRAINKSRTNVMTRLLRWLVAATGLPQARLRRSMRSFTATRERPEAAITVYPGREVLIKFNQQQQREHLPPSGFRARMPGSGHVGYFERTRTSVRKSRGRPGKTFNLPIDEVMGPPFTAYLTGVGMADLLAYGGERLRSNMEHEIAFIEQQAGMA